MSYMRYKKVPRQPLKSEEEKAAAFERAKQYVSQTNIQEHKVYGDKSKYMDVYDKTIENMIMNNVPYEQILEQMYGEEKEIILPATHVCVRCKVEKPLNKEYFYVNKKMSKGFNSYCIECNKRNYTTYNKTKNDGTH